MYLKYNIKIYKFLTTYFFALVILQVFHNAYLILMQGKRALYLRNVL